MGQNATYKLHVHFISAEVQTFEIEAEDVDQAVEQLIGQIEEAKRPISMILDDVTRRKWHMRSF